MRHVRKIDERAALQRHGLPVVAGAAAARGQRNAVTRRGAGDGDDIGFMARRDDNLGRFAVQLRIEDRAVPEEVA
jgi:hypothetical protein